MLLSDFFRANKEVAALPQVSSLLLWTLYISFLWYGFTPPSIWRDFPMTGIHESFAGWRPTILSISPALVFQVKQLLAKPLTLVHAALWALQRINSVSCMHPSALMISGVRPYYLTANRPDPHLSPFPLPSVLPSSSGRFYLCPGE